jgi:hypothetical protein
LLLQRDQLVFYLPGIAVNRASDGYRSAGKTDAKDAAIIADQARMQHDLRRLQVLDDDIAQLRLLTAYRADLAADRTRSINRLPASSSASFLPWNGFWTSPIVALWCWPLAFRPRWRFVGWAQHGCPPGWTSVAYAAQHGWLRPPAGPPRDNKSNSWSGGRGVPGGPTRPDRARARSPAHRC